MSSNPRRRSPSQATCPPRRQPRKAGPRPSPPRASSSSQPPSQSAPQVGDELDGKITRLTSYGAFVDIGGGRSGLLHISEVTAGFVADLSALLSVGQTVRVRVILFDADTGRIALSIRATMKPESTGYQRVVELGGDWGHPWADEHPDTPEDQKTRFMKLSPRPMPSPHLWEPDPELFREWHQPPPPVWDDTHYNPIEGRPSV